MTDLGLASRGWLANEWLQLHVDGQLKEKNVDALSYSLRYVAMFLFYIIKKQRHKTFVQTFVYRYELGIVGYHVGSAGRAVERRTVNRGDGGFFFLSLSLFLMVNSSLYVSHMFATRVLSSLVFQSCPSLELVSPLQVTHLPPVWDLLLPLA